MPSGGRPDFDIADLNPVLTVCLPSDPGLWVGDCFIYNNSAWRLNYCVGGEVTTMFHLDRPMYLLGYLASQSRIYLIDKVRRVLSHKDSQTSRRHPCYRCRWYVLQPSCTSRWASVVQCGSPTHGRRDAQCCSLLEQRSRA